MPMGDPQAVLDQFTRGEISPAQALVLLRQLEGGVTAVESKKVEAPDRVEDILQELDDLVGLAKVKELVQEVRAFVSIQKKRGSAGLLTEPLVLHMIFKGNPGTGKTTVARILGKLMKAMGVLEKGHLVEVERADLVGEYIGHTAQKTREQIKKALGGILFIDEAYSLARGGEKDFGKEAIDTLVKAMEDHKTEVVLILAGYRKEMAKFLTTNPGLKSRFPIHIEFSDYSTEELLDIAQRMLEQRQYVLSSEATKKLIDLIEKKKEEDPYAGNARLVRNAIERAIRKQAVRLVREGHSGREELMTITDVDIGEVDA